MCLLDRWTLATSLKYCMAGNAPVAELTPHMETFLEMMHNKDLDVKKAALLMVNAAVHHQVRVAGRIWRIWRNWRACWGCWTSYRGDWRRGCWLYWLAEVLGGIAGGAGCRLEEILRVLEESSERSVGALLQ